VQHGVDLAGGGKQPRDELGAGEFEYASDLRDN
jgi:hypothetical protein